MSTKPATSDELDQPSRAEEATELTSTVWTHALSGASAWDDIYDVFGNGDDYDWALEGEEEMMGGAAEGEQPKMEDVSLRFPPPLGRAHLFLTRVFCSLLSGV